jgi:hypothetical protein
MAQNLRRLRRFLQGGLVGDVVRHLSGSSATDLSGADVSGLANQTLTQGNASRPHAPLEFKVVTSGSAGNEVVRLPLRGEFIGQRLLVTFHAEGNASDVVRLNANASGALATQSIVGGTPTAPTNVDLDTVGEYALFEYVGGATPTWNVVYSTGALS